jgi:molybdate-binding protein
MGLMVKRGNPLGITSLKDIVDRRRASSIATMIPARGCCSTSCWRCTDRRGHINGAQQMEFTHAAVAASGERHGGRQLRRRRPPPGSSGSISSGF